MRQIMVVSLSAAALNIACAPVVLAADMPVKAPAYATAPAFVADPWTGWYLGGSAGARFNKDTWTGTGFEIPVLPALFSGRDNPHDFNSTSARFGLYGGYNWRVQQMWVVGVEADIAWTNSRKTSASGIPGLVTATTDSVGVKDGWDGGLRARLGYLITPSTLLFGTGGVSWMNSEASVSCGGTIITSLCTGSNIATLRTDTVSKTMVGWTVGGGAETVVMRNWLLRGEYRYTGYAGYHATFLANGGPGAIDAVEADVKTHTQTVLVGLAYRFGQ
jgi:outer membrane immunogenic protein